MGRVARIILALAVVLAGLVAQPAWAAGAAVQHGRHRRLDHPRL